MSGPRVMGIADLENFVGPRTPRAATANDAAWEAREIESGCAVENYCSAFPQSKIGRDSRLRPRTSPVDLRTTNSVSR
jgi:hypothetical protein